MKCSLGLLAVLSVVQFRVQVFAAPPGAPASPTVDLGYTVHQAITETTSKGLRYFNFTNIRYAAPPTGANRFKPPTSPQTNRSVQTAGPYPIICPQALPGWLGLAGQPTGNLTGVPPVEEGDIPPPIPGESEDCLFLDVLVPERIFRRQNPKASILVFLHGGGYVIGSKTTFITGVGLLEAAEENKQDMIYIAINYRIGMFGFLASGGGAEPEPNLGLLDQKFALEWIQTYAKKFGGDAASVGVMGESAGGGSIMYHLTSTEALSSTLPFKRAIAQSPYTLDIPPSKQQSTFTSALQYGNVSSFSELKALPTETLQTVNGLLVGNSEPYGTFTFGPVTDSGRYPGYPPVLITDGQYDKSIAMMAGHNTNEGLLFSSPFIQDNAAYEAYIRSLLPEASSDAITTITDVLYPNDLSGTYGYTSQFGRVVETNADALIVCNSYALSTSAEDAGAPSFAYQFSVPPGTHASEVPYTFFNPNEPTPGVNATLATIMQRYFVSFAVTGSPNPKHKGLPEFPAYDGGIVQNFNVSMFGPVQDNTSVERCNWWNRGLFL